MADTVCFIGWNKPVTGRELQAAALFKESMALYTTFQKEGRIENFEPVLLNAHGGDLNGFVLLRGTADKLNGVRADERFIDLVMKCGMAIDGFGVIAGYTGEGLEKIMGRWTMLASKA